jgi:hypothetical protein
VTAFETAQDSISSHQRYSFLLKITASGNPDSGRYLPSSSWAPPTPPESDGEDNDGLTPTLPARSIFHTDPYDFDVTGDALNPRLPYRSVFWQGLIIRAELEGNDRYWVIVRSCHHHHIVLPICNFGGRGLQEECAELKGSLSPSKNQRATFSTTKDGKSNQPSLLTWLIVVYM